VVAGFDAAEFLATTRALQRLYFGVGATVTAMLLANALLVVWQARVQDQARETADNANRMKGEFLSTISHEIRTPMNGVLGMLALLESEEDEPQQRRRATVARHSAEALLVLLDDILDFSKLEAGKVTIAAETCSPACIVDVVVELLRPEAERKGLVLSKHVGPSVPDAVVTDPSRLRQTLFNLTANAIKFTESGHVSLRAQCDAELSDGRFVLEFEIEDTGIGIASEAIGRLFNRFTQADSSITRKYGGSGLGLAICKRLRGLLGGDISVSSMPGKGSVFRFSITAAQADETITVHETAVGDIAAETIALPPLRILVTDDNAVNLQVVGALLTHAGHVVDTTDSGAAAIAAIRAAERQPFDVVLMDVQMPEMDGLTATREIRALPPPLNAVPVIALTAHASNSSRMVCLAAGMNGFASKPTRLPELPKEIAAVLDRAPAPSVPAPPAVAPEALLDAVQVGQLTASLSAEAWERIIASFARSADAEIDRIIAAIESGENPATAAHTLKGLAWNTGALLLGNLARRLETATDKVATG
jgi:signal transduction histidine kinase/DNA-binding response OmpR family regulator